MVRVLDASGMTFEIITVSDGSTDGSPFTLDGFPEHVVRQVSFATNVGKGSALRAGLGMGRGRYLGFIDADGDISPEFLGDFVSIMRSEKPDIIIGSQAPPRFLGALPAAAPALLVGLPATDPPPLPPEREGHPGRDQAGRPQRHRRGPAFAAREPLRARPRAPGAGPTAGVHADRRGAGADQGALRQHHLAQGRVAAPRRHARPLRPLLDPPRVRRGAGGDGGAGPVRRHGRCRRFEPRAEAGGRLEPTEQRRTSGPTLVRTSRCGG